MFCPYCNWLLKRFIARRTSGVLVRRCFDPWHDARRFFGLSDVVSSGLPGAAGAGPRCGTGEFQGFRASNVVVLARRFLLSTIPALIHPIHLNRSTQTALQIFKPASSSSVAKKASSGRIVILPSFR